MASGDLVNNFSLAANTAGADGAKAGQAAKAQAEKDARDAALKQLIQGMEGNQKLQEISAKGRTDVDTESGKQDVSIRNLPRVQAISAVSPDASSAKVGDVAIGADPYAKTSAGSANRISMQAKRLSGEAKGLDPLTHQMETLNLYHQMLDDPNKFDQKKLQVLGARLVEGNGQRLLDSVIQTMGGSKETLAGDVQSKLNYVLGKAKAGIPQEQANAMRDTAIKYQDEMMPQWDAASQKFKAYAPSIAPEVPNVGGLVDASLGEGTRLQQALNERKQKWTQARAAQAQAPAQSFAQGGPSQGAPASLGDKITNWLKGNVPGTPAAFAQPKYQTSPLSQLGIGQPSAQPQAGSMRVKHLSTGQTGTIPANEFDPSIYQQVQ